jgi:hypothetical protein
MKTIALVSFLLLFSSACGLIDPDIADFDLSLPEKDITVDTAQWELADEPTMPAIDCSGGMAQICSSGISQVCGADTFCFGSCNATSETCDVTVLLNLWHTFDLAAEKPELQEIEGQPLVSVSITKIAYRVSENTMNVDTPPLDVYVAPQSEMSTGGPQAMKIGRIAAVPAGELVEEGEVDVTEDGKAVLQGFMKNYTTPFNIIVGNEIQMSAGDTMPSGKMTAVVLVSAVAGI